MLFCMAFIHAGFIPALVVFLLWRCVETACHHSSSKESSQKTSLPVAIGMYGLSLGVEHMNSVLPSPVYALLSGLNASTVGIVALAAVQVGCLLQFRGFRPLICA